MIGLATLLLGATGVLMELHDALDTIWKVDAAPGPRLEGHACATGCCRSG